MNTQPKQDRSEAVTQAVHGPFQGLLIPCLISLLLGLRFLVPAESAARGDTLWIAQLWCALLLIVALLDLRSTQPSRRFDLLDGAVWTIVVGHIISGFSVIYGEGNRRAAINVMWEWVALGMSFHLLRQLLTAAGRVRSLMNAIVAITVCLTALGFWQHFVFYPQSSAGYQQDRAELDRLISSKPASPLEEQRTISRIRELTRQLQQSGVPLEGQSRLLFESRLQSSSEPFGPFALANTFGGLLAAVLILQVLQLLATRDKLAFAIQLLLALPTGWCLLLTKSRTAWVGFVVGALYGAWLNRAESANHQRVTRWAIAAVAIVSVGVAFVIGGLDQEVISESPKSLQYRLQYWVASLDMLKENPVLGAGAGNFRPHYLKHKLAESSEEIADPHNMFLDAWANGGLLALGGLLVLLTFVIWPRRNSTSASHDAKPTNANSERHQTNQQDMTIPLGFGMAFATTWLYESFVGESPDLRNWYLLAGFAVVSFLLAQIRAANISPHIFRAAGTGLLVHLIGAGGFEMPAIMQAALIFMALGFWSHINQKPTNDVSLPANSSGPLPNRIRRYAVLCVAGAACIGLMNTAFIPSVSARLHAKLGHLYATQGKLNSAITEVELAMAEDPFDPDLPTRMAELLRARWQQQADPQDFDFAQEFYQRAIVLDPVSAHRYQSAATLYSSRFAQSGNQQDISRAVELLQQAVTRYPTDVGIVQKLHFATHSAGLHELATQIGHNALQLDDINHSSGHTDRYLPQELRKQIEANLSGKRQKENTAK